MQSPKSHSKKKPRKSGFHKRKHSNKKFYNSKEWRETREAYIRSFEYKLYSDIPEGIWRLNSSHLEVTAVQSMYILSRDFVPCEICLKLYLADAYDRVEKGTVVDHIQPVNPENALNSEGYGQPFDFNNLQLLCERHHNKKSQRESYERKTD